MRLAEPPFASMRTPQLEASWKPKFLADNAHTNQRSMTIGGYYTPISMLKTRLSSNR